MAVVLGVISLVSLGAAVVSAGGREGESMFRYGVIGLLAAVYSATGLVLGILTAAKPDYYRLFPVLAIFLNGTALVWEGLILYMGAYL